MTGSTRAPAPKRTLVIADDAPSTPVAFPMDARSGTFGLEAPTPLLGGHALAPDGLPSATGLDHVPGLRSFLADACLRQVLAGRAWYHHPPLALIGPEGLGRGLVARRVADATGAPLVAVGMRDLEDAAERTSKGDWTIPVPVLAMAMTRCANPIVLLDVPQSGTGPQASRLIAEMLDPTRNGRWLDQTTRTVFDLSNVSWIIQAPRLCATVAAIVADAGTAIGTPFPTSPAERLRRLSVAHHVARDPDDGRSDPDLVATIFAALEEGFAASANPVAKALVEHARDVLARDGRGR